MTALSVPEVLRRAEAIIGERGWLVGGLENPHTGAVCMIGAVRVAVAGSTYPGDMNNEAYALADQVTDLLWEFLAESPDGWNDAPGRTAEEVRAALLRAADRAVTE